LFYKEIQKRESDLPAITLQYVIVDDNGRIVSRADFAFVEERLAVYCDGARYHLQKDQWRRDQRQRRELVRLGWSVLVFTGAEINEAPDRCVEEVVRTLSGRREAGPGMR
jgi:very-short-patch-repair endonuclease